MKNELARLRRRYPWLKPWAVVATFMAVVILGDLAFFGLGYWNASAMRDTLANQLAVVQRSGVPSSDALEADIEAQEKRLEELQATFGDWPAYEIMAIAHDTAQQAGAVVESITAGELRSERQGAFDFQTQTMTAVVRGQTDDIYQFLTLLNREVPMAVTDISLEDLDDPEGSPSADLKLVFYLSPELPEVPKPGEQAP